MTRAQAIDFINSVDSKHQSLQPVLRQLARGEAVSAEEVDALAESDSRLSQVAPVVKAIATGRADKNTLSAINELDSFGAPLQPVLLALVQGFTE